MSNHYPTRWDQGGCFSTPHPGTYEDALDSLDNNMYDFVEALFAGVLSYEDLLSQIQVMTLIVMNLGMVSTNGTLWGMDRICAALELLKAKFAVVP